MGFTSARSREVDRPFGLRSALLAKPELNTRLCEQDGRELVCPALVLWDFVI